MALTGLSLAIAVEAAKEEKPVPPPKGALVLFDGKDLSGWITRDGKPAAWKAENGYMEVVPGKGDILTKEKFGPDFQLHVEFWLPLMPDKKDQARANSGIFLQGRYEVQVLDSYMNKTYANGSCGALYGLVTPDLEAQQKAVRPPEQWQTFDITFQAPRVDSRGKVTQKGRITVVLNGVTIINNGTFDRIFAHVGPGGAFDDKIGMPGPILLQDHGNKVRYRNIWLKSLKEDE